MSVDNYKYYCLFTESERNVYDELLKKLKELAAKGGSEI